jgi:hypothetical protein
MGEMSVHLNETMLLLTTFDRNCTFLGLLHSLFSRVKNPYHYMLHNSPEAFSSTSRQKPEITYTLDNLAALEL